MEVPDEATVVRCRSCNNWLGPVSSLSKGLLGKRKNTEPIPFSCPECGTAIVERKGENYSTLKHGEVVDLKSLSEVELATTLFKKVARASRSTKVVLDEAASRSGRRRPP